MVVPIRLDMMTRRSGVVCPAARASDAIPCLFLRHSGAGRKPGENPRTYVSLDPCLRRDDELLVAGPLPAAFSAAQAPQVQTPRSSTWASVRRLVMVIRAGQPDASPA